MKDELQLKLVEILTSIQNTAGKAGDFAMEQLPDIASSYIAYGRAVSLVAVMGGCLALYALARFYRWLAVQHEKDDLNPIVFFGGLGGIAGAIVAVTALVAAANSMLLVWFAPKVWLLKEIASLIK